MRGTLYLMVGIPGSGKSTFAKSLKGKYVSRDEVRFSIIKEEDEYFSKEDEVFETFINRVNEYLEQGEDVIADATHLNKGSRWKLLSKVQASKVMAIFMDTSLDVCLERNAQREGRAVVPERVIRQMYLNLTVPSYDEGIDGIFIVKGGIK